MNRLTYLTFFSLTLLHTNSSFAETVFTEQNGRLLVEIESAPAVSNWHPTADFPNYTGTAAYEWTGAGTTGARNADAGALTFHFKINTPGNYEFRWRSRIGEGTNATEANDSWVRFPTGSNISGEHALSGWTKGYMNQIGEWSWRTVTVDHVGEPIRQHFTAGDHTLEIAGRSKGHVLDRFVLFKYDSVNFHDETFTQAPQSSYTGDEIEVIAVQPEPEPEPEPEQQTDPATDVDNAVTDTPVAQPWQIPVNQQNANECSSGVISLRPVNDVYAHDNEIIREGDLLVDSTGQIALLKFDLSGVPATVASAALTFNVSEAGEGEIMLSAGSHSNWDESDNSQLPDISHLIGSFNGTWNQETRYGLPFEPTLIGTDSATLTVEMTQGADGISIISSGNEEEPRLLLTGPENFCSEYEANPENTTTPDTELKTEADSVDDSETDGGGLMSLQGLLLLTLLLGVYRGYLRQS